jgi:hypothetical protein
MKSELNINVFGTKEWKLPNGKWHREDGPAIEIIDGRKYWYLSGIEYTKKEYKYEIRSRKLKQLL